jgi:hypothetical protein
LGAELLRALRYGQNQISPDGKLRLLELFQAAVHYICIAMDKKDTQGTGPVRSRAVRTDIPSPRQDFVLNQL